MVLPNNRRSITITINDDKYVKTGYVFMIRSVDVDKITLDKFDVDYRDEIEAAWGDEYSVKSMVIKLTEKTSSMTLIAYSKAVEKAVNNLGLIVEDVVIIRPPKAKKVRISDIKLFDNIKE